MGPLRRQLLAAGVAMLALVPRPAGACELELVLALDVSGSVDYKEFELQARGVAEAFRSPDLRALILSHPDREVHVSVVQWSGAPHQAQIVPWTHLASDAVMDGLADALHAQQRWFKIYATSISNVIDFARELLAGNGLECRRRVIDVSGDGKNNEGGELEPARQRALDAGITINGLAILSEETDLDDYYRQRVLAGTDAFLEIASSFRDFPDAMRRKLMREVSPPTASLERSPVLLANRRRER